MTRKHLRCRDDSRRLVDTSCNVGRVQSGKLEKNQSVAASLSPSRQFTMQNHTATHIANWAHHVKSSAKACNKKVAASSIRKNSGVRFLPGQGDEAMKQIEHKRRKTRQRINQHKNCRVYAEVSAAGAGALKINGLREAVFGEKYPQMVRVVFSRGTGERFDRQSRRRQVAGNSRSSFVAERLSWAVRTKSNSVRCDGRGIGQ